MLLKAVILLIAASTIQGACKAKPSAIEQVVLDAHNGYRKLHTATLPLCYGESDSAVTYTSQSWSENQVKNKAMKHSSGAYGENLYWSSSDTQINSNAYKIAVKFWYEEIKDWNFEKSEGKLLKTGHFTQVVWKDSQEVRCGFAQSSVAGTFVTCQYYKAGNYRGEYAANVAPIGDGKNAAGPVIHNTGTLVLMLICLFVMYFNY